MPPFAFLFYGKKTARDTFFVMAHPVKKYTKKQKAKWRPFDDREGEFIKVSFWGDKKKPKITFKRVVRDKENNPIRYDGSFSHDDLYKLLEAVEWALGTHNPGFTDEILKPRHPTDALKAKAKTVFKNQSNDKPFGFSNSSEN